MNDVPHIGHAYTTIAADVLARFHQLAGRQTYFLTGTDEHGSKVAEAARAAGLSPQKFCDNIVRKFTDAWKNLDIENDYFIRTTSERHAKGVRKILDAMREAKTDDGQDVVYSDYYEGLYCTGCEKFVTEKDLVDGVCPDHKVAPEKIREKNYFFRLTAFAVRTELGDHIIGVDLVAESFGHFITVDGKETVKEQCIRHFHAGGHQHGRPIETVKLENVFGHQVNDFTLCPPFLKRIWIIVIANSGYIVGEGVNPNIGHLGFIERQ